MEEENLRDSLWFKQLTKMHKKTCVLAAKNGYFVAIPQTCSLTTTVVTQKDIGKIRHCWMSESLR